jgi:hypothetical protein
MDAQLWLGVFIWAARGEIYVVRRRTSMPFAAHTKGPSAAHTALNAEHLDALTRTRSPTLFGPHSASILCRSPVSISATCGALMM